MKTLSIREARQGLTHLEALLERHGEVLITRRGKTIARVVPVQGARSVPSHKALRRSMPTLDVPSDELVRADREGR